AACLVGCALDVDHPQRAEGGDQAEHRTQPSECKHPVVATLGERRGAGGPCAPPWGSAAARANPPKKPASGGAPASERKTSAIPSARAGRSVPIPARAASPPSPAPLTRDPQVAATTNAPSRNSEPARPVR